VPGERRLRHEYLTTDTPAPVLARYVPNLHSHHLASSWTKSVNLLQPSSYVVAHQSIINTRPSLIGNQYNVIHHDYGIVGFRVRVYVIFTTLEPSTTPSKLLALTTPFCLRASSSSHQPKRKSRAMSLNHGVNELPIKPRSQHHSPKHEQYSFAYPDPRTLPATLPCQRICSRESHSRSGSPSRRRSGKGCNQLNKPTVE
jgi:hypothetical protein